MTFGEKLQKLRKARNLSQEELAAQLSVTRQTISKWELDQSTPELGLLAQLSDIFGVTTDYLIKEDMGTVPCRENLAADIQSSRRPNTRQTLYIVLLCIGAAVILTAWILSVFHPWEVILNNGHTITGFWGFVRGTRSTVIVLLSIAALLTGLIGLIRPVLREMKARKSETTGETE